MSHGTVRRAVPRPGADSDESRKEPGTTNTEEYLEMGTAKKEYTAPQLVVHGTIVELTQQVKNKVFGSGDDVLINNQAILANIS